MTVQNPFQENDFFPELTPLIDVMFLLLVFFMLTTTFEQDTIQKRIPVELPFAAQSSPVLKENTVTVTVKEKGEYLVNGKSCSQDAFSDVLRLVIQETKDSVVCISGHSNAPFSSIIFIYDAMQSLGIRDFSHEVQ